MGTRHHGVRQHRAVHVGVASRFMHQRSAKPVVPSPQPIPFLRHRRALRPRESVDDQPERLTRGMCVDRLDPTDHQT